MKKILFFVAFATVACAAILSSCKKEDEPSVEITDPADKTQTAYADQSAGGDFTFTASYAWTATVKETAATRASGVDWLTLKSNGAEKYDGAAGTFTLSIELKPNYTGSPRAATITINSGTATVGVTMTQQSTTQGGQTLTPTIALAAQSGELKAGAAGTATFAATTAGIDDGKTGAVAWFSDAGGEITGTASAGISAAVSAVANNAATVTITATTASVSGTYYFKTTIDGTTSAVATLTIGAAALAFTDDAAYDIPAMTVGAAIADIDLSDAATGGTHPYTFGATGLPAGIAIDPATGVISGTPTTVAEAGTATITVTDATTPTTQSKSITIGYGAIIPAPTYTISASTLTSFGSKEEGDTPPAAQMVTITNTGTGAVTLNQPAATNYTVGTLSTATLAAGATATFTVRPKANLSDGTYNETITITGTNNAKATVFAQFTVTEPAPTYTYSVALDTPATGELDFGSVDVGYAQPVYKGVRIKNTGTGEVILQATAPTGYDFYLGNNIGTVAVPAGSWMDLDVRPKADLAPGVYNQTFDIIASKEVAGSLITIETISITVKFTVTAATGNNITFGKETEENW